MSEIYWITRLDAANGAMWAIMFISLLAVITMAIIHAATDECGKDDFIHRYGRKVKCCAAVSLISLLGLVFTPTQRDMLLIYGIGGTIDYIKHSDTAKQLPDKAVQALDRLLGEYIGDNDGKTE